MSSLDNIEHSKEVLLNYSRGISSPDQETRRIAEQELQTFKAQGIHNFGLHLVNHIAYYNDPIALLKVASTLLKQYVETHWCPLSEGSQASEISLETKIQMKRLLLYGLCKLDNKVICAVADSILTIARSDWPENWPTLFDELVRLSTGSDEKYYIDGVMCVFAAFAKELTATQLPHGGPIILREIYRIFDDKDKKYSVDIRGRAVGIFAKMITTISAYKQPELIQQYLEPSITKFCDQFVQNDLKSEAKLGCEILGAIQVLMKSLPKCIATFLPKMLPVIWETLIHSAQVYHESTVNIHIDDQADEDDTENADSVASEEGPVESVDENTHSDEEESDYFDDLVKAIFGFVRILMSGSNGHTLDLPEYNLLDYQWFYLQDSLPPEVLHHLIFFIQFNDEQIEQWTNNPSQFIIAENPTDDASDLRSRRSEAQELLMKIVHRSKRAAANALCDMILKQIAAGDAMRATSSSETNENWWKLHEASIKVFGMIKDVVIEEKRKETLRFDVVAFLEEVVLADLSDSGNHPLLLGRCLYVGGLYVEHMPVEMRSSFLEATLNALKNRPVCTRICAAKAVNYWLRAASINGYDKENILRPKLPTLFQELFNLGNQFMSAEVLTIILENFATLASLDKTFTASVERKISALAIAAFVHYRSNCLVLEICVKIFKELTLNPECVEPLQTHLVPMVVGKLNVNPSQEVEEDEAQVDALEVLILLVQHSLQPLSSFLIESAFPAACRFILSSDKYCTLLKGGQVMRMYLSVSADQVIGYKNTDDETGPQYILRVATHLLNFQVGTQLAGDACEIVILLLKRANVTLGENDDVDELLKAVFGNMQCTNTRARSQRLLMLWAHFIKAEFETVFKFLSTAQGPDEQSAFSFVISNGLCKEHESFDRDDRKTVTLALSKILEHSVTHQDSALHQITLDEGEGDSATTIPLLVQISKLISNELSLDNH